MKDDKNKINKDRKEIEKSLTGNSKDRDMFQDQGKRRQIVIDHMKCLNDMIKAIQMTPMPDYLKGVLRLRLVERMTCFDIALKYGTRLHYIIDLEIEAKERVIDYLKKHQIEDIVNKFNSENSVSKVADLKNDLANPQSEEAAKNEGVKDHVKGND